MENVMKGISGDSAQYTKNIYTIFLGRLKLKHIFGIASSLGLSYVFINFLVSQEKEIFIKLWQAYKITVSL